MLNILCDVHNLHFKYFVIMVDVDVLYLAVGIWQQRRCLYTNNSTSCILCAMYLDLFVAPKRLHS